MEITLVSSVFPYPRRGVFVGIERFVDEYSQALLNKGHNVRVITTFWNGGKEKEEYNGIEIHRVSDSSLRFGKIGRLFDMHYSTFGKNVLKCEAVKAADIVHAVSTLTTTEDIRKTGVPVFSQFHHKGEIRGSVDYLTLPFHLRNERNAHSGSDVVFTTSEASRAVLITDYRVEASKIRIIPLGVDTSKFQGKKRRSEKTTLLFVGPLIKRKGVEYLIKAFKEIENKDVKLILIGQGRERKKLESLVKRLGLKNVEFKGYLEDEELIKHYNMADIFVLPSLKEGFGQVLLEAMTCGLPIVATDATAIPEVVGNAGILVEPRNPKALANAIRVLMDDEELRGEFGERGRKRVEENFTWENVAERCVTVYKEEIRKR